MGLDSVELVMDVEDRFGVKLPDAECQRVRTVADLAALIIRFLPRDIGACGEARGFFELRKLLTHHAGIERGQVRPRVRLIELFPPHERQRWNQICRKDRRLPALIATPRIATVIRWLAGIGILLWFIVSAALWLWLGPVAFPMAFAVLTVCAWAFCVVTSRFAVHFPHGIETVGDVARIIAPIDVGEASPGQRLIAQQRVLDEVRRLTAQQLDLPPEKVQPAMDFVKDLNMG